MAFSKVVLLVVAALCIAQASAGTTRVVRAAGDVSKAVETAQSQIVALNNEFNKAVGVKDNQDYARILKDSITQIANNGQTILGQIQSEIKAHSADLDPIWAKFTQTINSALTDLQAAHPDATAQGKQLQEQLQSGTQTIIAEVDKVAKSLSKSVEGPRQELAKYTKNLVDQTVQTLRSTQAQVQDNIRKHQATHSH